MAEHEVGGAVVGEGVGFTVGAGVGATVGVLVVGAGVGATVGVLVVGAGVGAAVGGVDPNVADLTPALDVVAPLEDFSQHHPPL